MVRILPLVCLILVLVVSPVTAEGWLAVLQETESVVLAGRLDGQEIRRELEAPPMALRLHPTLPQVWLAYPGENSRIVSLELPDGTPRPLAEFPGYISDFDVQGGRILAALKSGPDFATSCVVLREADGRSQTLLNGDAWFYNAPRFLPDPGRFVASRAWLPDPEIPKLTLTEIVVQSLQGGEPRVLAGGDWAYDAEGQRSGYRASCPSSLGGARIGFLRSNDSFERYYSEVGLEDAKLTDRIGPEETMSFPVAAGESLYFLRYAEAGDPAGELLRQPLAGGKAESLARSVLRFTARP